MSRLGKQSQLVCIVAQVPPPVSKREQTERMADYGAMGAHLPLHVCRYALDLIPCLSDEMTCGRLNSIGTIAPLFSLSILISSIVHI